MTMDEQAKVFIKAYFSPELAGDREELNDSLRNSSAEYRKRIKDGLAELLRTRSIPLVKFSRLTDSSYESEDELYADIAASYEAMFGEPAPQYDLPPGDSPN
jgi:hypothetical protein